MDELPVTEDLRCAPWTAARGIDPVGSATRFDRLVAVEVPQPWSAKVEDMDWVAPLDVPSGTRVQAIVAEVGRTDGSVLLTGWERVGARLAGVDWLVAAEDVPAALAALVAGGEPRGDASEAPAELLVCGHGARDRCCGGPGTRLAIDAGAALGGEVRVRRTSHLGGHRFAPTALTLPEGRQWAHLDLDVLAGIVHRTLPAAEARRHYRGNAALDPWAQVVEAELLTTFGWGAFDVDELAAATAVHDDRASVRLRWSSAEGSGERSGEVEIAGRYPVLQCGQPPSEAEKDSPEYRLR